MIEAIGTAAIASLLSVAELVRLFFESSVGLVSQIARFRMRRRETIEQMYAIGWMSLPVVLFSLVFVTFMLITEFSFHMKLVLRQDSLVPAFSTVLMMRELGPVITCILLTSRVGAAIAAEIGSMKITEQLDALEVLAVDPVEYLLIPRWIGCVFASVSLSIVALGVSVVAGAFLAGVSLGYSPEQYLNTMFVFTRFSDFRTCLVKALVFGTIVPMVASHQGFRCGPGSAGVGTAATNAVVHGSMLIIISDFFLTFGLYAG